MAVQVVVLRYLQLLELVDRHNLDKVLLVEQMQVTLPDMAGAGAGVLQQAGLPALLQPVETGGLAVLHRLPEQQRFMLGVAGLVSLLVQALL
jgi:hypothetical protein